MPQLPPNTWRHQLASRTYKFLHFRRLQIEGLLRSVVLSLAAEKWHFLHGNDTHVVSAGEIPSIDFVGMEKETSSSVCVCVCVCVSVCLSVCLSICLSVSLFVSLPLIVVRCPFREEHLAVC